MEARCSTSTSPSPAHRSLYILPSMCWAARASSSGSSGSPSRRGSERIRARLASRPPLASRSLRPSTLRPTTATLRRCRHALGTALVGASWVGAGVPLPGLDHYPAAHRRQACLHRPRCARIRARITLTVTVCRESARLHVHKMQQHDSLVACSLTVLTFNFLKRDI